MRAWLQQKLGGGRFADTNNRLIQRLTKFHYLWQFSRQRCLRGVIVGLFWAMQPMPFQMVPATLCACLMRANLPIALAGVWISNPITMGPMMFFNYLIGVSVLGLELLPFTFSVLSPESWWQLVQTVWQPLLLGSLLVGIVSALVGYLIVNLLWRITVMRKYKRRF